MQQTLQDNLPLPTLNSFVSKISKLPERYNQRQYEQTVNQKHDRQVNKPIVDALLIRTMLFQQSQLQYLVQRTESGLINIKNKSDNCDK